MLGTEVTFKLFAVFAIGFVTPLPELGEGTRMLVTGKFRKDSVHFSHLAIPRRVWRAISHPILVFDGHMKVVNPTIILSANPVTLGVLGMDILQPCLPLSASLGIDCFERNGSQ
jgi:hypothetical protein